MSARKKRKFKVKRHEFKSYHEAKKQLRKFDFKTAGLLLLSFTIFFGAFRLGIYFEWKPIYPIYYVLLLVTLALWLWFNQGFGSKLPAAEDLNMPEEEKQPFLDRLARDRRIAKKLLLILIPLLLTFAFDFVALFWIDTIRGLFK